MRTLLTRLLAPCLALLVPACASTSFSATQEAPTLYGSYLAARYAGATNDPASASRYYRQALALDPGDAQLVERAFATALASGDMDEAVRLAREAAAIEPADRLARIVLATDALKRDDTAGARVWLQGEDLGPFNRVIGGLMLAWSQAADEDFDGAIATLDAQDTAPVVRHLAQIHRALVLDQAGRGEAAEEAYREAFNSGLLRSVVVDAYGAFLERAGRGEDARALYRAQLIDAPDDPVAVAGLARLAAAGAPSPELMTARQGAAAAIYAPAATLASNTRSDLAIVYLRLAVHLDEGDGAARFLLGELLRQADRDSEALEALDAVPTGSPYYPPAQVAAAWTFVDGDDLGAAEARLERLVARTRDRSARIALADVYRGLERFEDGAVLYNELIEEARASGDEDDWRLFYARGICYEQTDRFDAAVADFRTALTLFPDQPSVLNYLGYSWVDRGENLDEALGMIRRAVELRPDAGYIIDSLGWAHYRLGDYEEATRLLERAVELDPQDPVINDHLGDAYWRVGRAIEAVYQWNRALSLDPETEDEDLIRVKLVDGLPVISKPEVAYAP